MKRTKILLACMFLTMSMTMIMPALAAENANTVVAITTVTIDGQEIEVPMELSVLPERSAAFMNSDSRRVYIPYTEQAKEKNKAIVNNIMRTRGSSDSFTEKDGYIYFESTLNYNRDYFNNDYNYPRIDLISFKITREIITSAPFDGFRNANAIAYQMGSPGPPSDFSPLSQKKSYNSISYGSLQSVPTSWQPVVTVGTPYNRGVEYSIPIIYTDHQETLKYFHEAS